jgi:hypothetical protein
MSPLSDANRKLIVEAFANMVSLTLLLFSITVFTIQLTRCTFIVIKLQYIFSFCRRFLLGCNTVWSLGRNILTLYVSPNRWYLPTSPHGVTTQKDESRHFYHREDLKSHFLSILFFCSYFVIS